MSFLNGSTCTRGGASYKGFKERGKVIFGPASLEYEVWLGQEPQDDLHFMIEPNGLKFLAEQNNLDPSRIELLNRIGVEDRQIEHLALAYLAEMEAGNPSGRLFLDTLGLAMAARLMADYTKVPIHLSAGGNSFTRLQFRRVLEFIETHLNENCSLEILARQTEMDVYRFCHAFKSSFGVSPHQYVLAKRIEKAKILLKETNRSVTEIGLDVGFNSSSQFSRIFRQLAGITPLRYRQSSR